MYGSAVVPYIVTVGLHPVQEKALLVMLFVKLSS